MNTSMIIIFHLLADSPSLHGAAAKAEEVGVPVLGVFLQHRFGEVGSHPPGEKTGPYSLKPMKSEKPSSC